MKKPTRPIWINERDNSIINVIDQRYLPHRVDIFELKTKEDTIFAIKNMVVRGAPLIGVTGAYGVYLSLLTAKDEKELISDANDLKNARPTAINLIWAVDEVLKAISDINDFDKKKDEALKRAKEIEAFEVECSRSIGEFGAKIIKEISIKKGGKPVNILTHCNAGFLATVEYGTATAPMYIADEQGTDIHIWVDETRPLNQGARLTAWELGEKNIKHSVITDNTGGHLMQHNMVDMVIVGTDRTTHTGDVANKIGTYLKALAAKDNNIPFYVALPSSTFDWEVKDGVNGIPIEERDGDEIKFVTGFDEEKIREVLITPLKSKTVNYAFDVTPARLVTGFITERGVCRATEKDILNLFPEKKKR